MTREVDRYWKIGSIAQGYPSYTVPAVHLCFPSHHHHHQQRVTYERLLAEECAELKVGTSLVKAGRPLIRANHNIDSPAVVLCYSHSRLCRNCSSVARVFWASESNSSSGK